jgi:uncharacterized protein YybS (DUF2232 family)
LHFYLIPGLPRDNKLIRSVNVAPQVQKSIDFNSIGRVILLCAVVITLPAIDWSIFGWMHILLPLLSFYVLSRYGSYTGLRFLITAAAVSAVVFLVLKSFSLFVFSAVLLLGGYVLHQASANHDSPAKSGLKTFGTLALGWVVILGFFTYGAEVSPYRQLVNTLDIGIGEALLYYRQSDSVSSETLVILEATLFQMKVIVPLIMPAILGSLILMVTWFTMIVGNNLLIRIHGDSPWPTYGTWQLPEKLIWVAILSGGASLLPIPVIQMAGINGLILIVMIYCFQGLAISVFYMNKWKVPILIRSFFYVMMVVQSFGTVILLVLGIGDIWLDLRKLKTPVDDDQE